MGGQGRSGGGGSPGTTRASASARPVQITKAHPSAAVQKPRDKRWRCRVGGDSKARLSEVTGDPSGVRPGARGAGQSSAAHHARVEVDLVAEDDEGEVVRVARPCLPRQ